MNKLLTRITEIKQKKVGESRFADGPYSDVYWDVESPLVTMTFYPVGVGTLITLVGETYIVEESRVELDMPHGQYLKVRKT